MFNVIDFYKNNKKRIYECFGNNIADKLYYENTLSTNDIYTLISEIINMSYDGLNKKIECM